MNLPSYPMGVAPPPPSGSMGGTSGYPGAPPGAQGYPGYPQPPGCPQPSPSGYLSQPSYACNPPAPGFLPQPGYPSQFGYTAPTGYQCQPGSYPGSPLAPGFHLPPSDCQLQQGYQSSAFPSCYPQQDGSAYPNQPCPGQPPYPIGTSNPPPPGFNLPAYSHLTGNQLAGGPPGQPTYYSSNPSQTQYAQHCIEGPNDYSTSIEYLRRMSKEELTEDSRRPFCILAGQDGEIDAFELKDILNKVFQRDFKFEGFTVDLTRSMVAMSDYDLSGKLNFEDFRLLWSDLVSCKKTFISLGADKSGYLNCTEFHKALSSNIGITISENVLKAMVMRYSDKDGNIRFNDFVACYIKLKTMTKTFRAKDVYSQGIADFDRDEYVQLCMYS